MATKAVLPRRIDVTAARLLDMTVKTEMWQYVWQFYCDDFRREIQHENLDGASLI